MRYVMHITIEAYTSLFFDANVAVCTNIIPNLLKENRLQTMPKIKLLLLYYFHQVDLDFVN